MIPNFRYCFFLFSFFLITTVSFAQNVFIANDFVACGVGLKDSSGQWIVQPIYQDIDKWPNGFFNVLSGSKEGVIDAKGTVIIPPIYDKIQYTTTYVDSTEHFLFYIINDGQTGLMNTRNQFVIPIVCRMIDVGSDGTIIAEKTRKRYSIYTLDGRETVIPKKQGTTPESLGDRMYKVSRNAFGLTFVERYFPKSKKEYRQYRYRLTLRKKYGVINDSLKVIVPKKFSGIFYGPEEYNLITVEKRNTSGYYAITGKQIWAPVYKTGSVYRNRFEWGGPTTTTMNEIGMVAAGYNKKYGIIGANGDTILPFIYSYIEIYDTPGNALNWKVKVNGHTGIYNATTRTWTLQPEYDSFFPIANFRFADDTVNIRRDRLYDSYYTSYGDGYKLMLARKNGKYGIITSDGKEILPFIYDDFESESGGYLLRKDSSYWMVTVPKYTLPKTFSLGEISRSVIPKAPADLQFQKRTLKNGTTVFVNPDLLTDSLQLSMYNLKHKNSVVNPYDYDHLLHAAALIVTPLYSSTNLAGIGNVYSYHSADLNYQPEDSLNYFIIRNKKGELYTTPVRNDIKDAYHTYYSVGYVGGVYRDDGLQVLKPYSYRYANSAGEINGVEYFTVYCGKNKTGLVDGNGKLLVDTTWGSIGSSRGNYIWVRKKEHYRGKNYTWNILDTTTNQLLLDKKLRSHYAPDFGAHAVILSRPEGNKLYNMDTRKYILDGNVGAIFKLDSAGNYFAVKTCYGNIGVIDGSGKWITDTIWKMIINADNRERNLTQGFRSRYYSKNQPFGYCVLSNDTGWIAIDSYSGKVSRDKKTAAAYLSLSYNSLKIDSVSGITKFCTDCPSYSYADTLFRDEKLSDWQEAILFDSLFTPAFMPDTMHSWFTFTCKDCIKRNRSQYFPYTWSGNYDQETLHHLISFKNDSCISVSRTLLNTYYYRQGNPKDLFFTVILFDDGPHAMLLDSLFTGIAWKEIITTETSLYFESHPNIEGNCHNPYMLPFVMKDRFIITPEGIQLYPPNYKENGKQLSVPISWEKLKPYLRKDIAKSLV